MKSNIIKIFVCLLFFSFVFAQKAAANAPDIEGHITSLTDTPINYVDKNGTPQGYWVEWKDGLQGVRYVQADLNGYFFFRSWQDMGAGEWILEFNKKINPNFDGFTKVPQAYDLRSGAYATLSDDFGCNSNPHQFTAIVPFNKAGYFDTLGKNPLVEIEITNARYTLDIGNIQYHPPIASAPIIDHIHVSNSNDVQASPFVGTFGVSGNLKGQNGSSWFNPIRITLDATPASGTTIKDYYVAFYKSAAPISPLITDLVNGGPNIALKDILAADPSNGFLLTYDAGIQKYYVWNPSARTWLNITGKVSGQRIINSQYCIQNPLTNICYTAYPGDAQNNPPDIAVPNTWTILFDQGFGTKTMYTGAQVVDSNNHTTTKADMPIVP